ncbi:probable disease resistance protein At4g33300 isoform X3 [Prosopis cineraria]|uniref:probable disease resistance protein At4g33300 isoform X3 n=1 Tax=Prosopis cineraria TaxID=364024 RepID=UPI00240ED3E7|nr:probable disease resistance protein At4g33300 isoform X3 [Prosopis cineraria]
MYSLKYVLLHDNQQVLNLIGLPGSGKTTLAETLCHDDDVRDKFNNSIIFEKMGSQGKSREAFMKLKEKLSNQAYPVLLVLDDVLSDWENIIEWLTGSRSPDSKILVTSRGQITTLGTTYSMELLSPEDAEILFLHFVRPSDIDFGDRRIREMLRQIVNGCKGLALAIEFMARDLRRKPIEEFQKVQSDLSRGGSILDSNEDLRARLQDFLDESNKEFFMDLGLFTEDQDIPITALIDMWIELYELDELGISAMIAIYKLIALGFAARIKVPSRAGGSDLDNYYSNHLLMQHGLLRELAIRTSNEEPAESKGRLILDMFGNHQRP